MGAERLKKLLLGHTLSDVNSDETNARPPLPQGFEDWDAELQSDYLNGYEVEALQVASAREVEKNRDKVRAGTLAIEKALCQKLKALREGKGWSQAELASRLNDVGYDFHQTTIAKLEAGKRPLRVAELYAFSFAFRMPVQALISVPLSADPISPSLASLEARLADLDQARQQNRDSLMQIIEQLADVQSTYELERLRLAERMRDYAAMKEDPPSGDIGEPVRHVFIPDPPPEHHVPHEWAAEQENRNKP